MLLLLWYPSIILENLINIVQFEQLFIHKFPDSSHADQWLLHWEWQQFFRKSANKRIYALLKSCISSSTKGPRTNTATHRTRILLMFRGYSFKRWVVCARKCLRIPTSNIIASTYFYITCWKNVFDMPSSNVSQLKPQQWNKICSWNYVVLSVKIKTIPNHAFISLNKISQKKEK